MCNAVKIKIFSSKLQQKQRNFTAAMDIVAPHSGCNAPKTYDVPTNDKAFESQVVLSYFVYLFTLDY